MELNKKPMPRSSFGSGLVDDDKPSQPVQPAEPQTVPASPPASPATETEHFEIEDITEKRSPFAWSFTNGLGGMALELGPGARATMVDHDGAEWLVSLSSDGTLKAARLEPGDSPSVLEPCPLFGQMRWAACDARTCDQTGQVIWAGIELTTGSLFATVDLGSAMTGGSAEPICLGKTAELDLPGNPQHIAGMQLADLYGRGRLDLILAVKPEREPGGPCLQALARNTDNFLDGFHPAKLVDADADRLLARDAAARLLLVSWSGPGTAQWLHISGDGKLNLLTNFGGILPPVPGRPRPLTSAQTSRPALLAAAETSVAWKKEFRGTPGKLVAVSRSGRVSIAQAVGGEKLGPFVDISSKLSGDLVFGPHAVATTADWDHDGGVDLIVGSADGSLTLYMDKGTPGQPASAGPERLESGGLPFTVPAQDRRRLTEPAAEHSKYSCPTLADWTAHGRMDVILADSRGAVWYMRNNGGKTQPRLDFADRVTCGGRPLYVAPRSQLAVAHWSGHAEPDLIGFDEDGELAYWVRREKLDLEPAEKIRDVRERTIRLNATGPRAGLVHLWAGAWTKPGVVELLVAVPKFAVGRVADWLEIPLEKEHEQFPLFWMIQRKDSGGVITRPIRTADGSLVHRQMPDNVRSYSLCPITLAGRTEPDLLVVPEQGKAILWPRECLRWD